MSDLIRILLSWCLIIACGSCQAAGVIETTIYRSLPIDGAHSEVRLDENRGKLTIGDLTVNMQKCADTEAYECFSSEFLSFAVPKNVVSEIAPWTVNGIEYSLLGYSEEGLLGQAVGIFAIAANINGTNLVFYYAQKRGLIAFSGLNAGSTILLSVEYCGFGAENVCAAPP